MSTESTVDPSPPALSRTRGLKPWRKGTSGNPKGTRKDGKPTVRQVLGSSAFRDELNRILSDPANLAQLAHALFKLAIDGNGPAWQHLLARLDPIQGDQHGRIVLEGIKLELSPEGRASVTIAQSVSKHSDTNMLDTGNVSGTEPPRATDYVTVTGSDASSHAPESQVGGAETAETVSVAPVTSRGTLGVPPSLPPPDSSIAGS